MEERRKEVRFPVQVKVQEESGAYNFSFAYGTDVSKDGMALEPRIMFSDERRVKEGAKLKLKFKLPGGEFFLNMTGRVVWIEDAGDRTRMGVKFESPSKDFESDFARFVQKSGTSIP